MVFFNNLNFTSSNEDGQTELKALQTSKHRLVCLSGSGTRPLDMLFTNAQEIIAIDLNPSQNALVALKVAAISMLDYEDYLQFIGVKPSNQRAEVYSQLRPLLSPEMAAFWDKNKKLVIAGLWYSGLWEKVLRTGAGALKLMRGQKVANLFAAQTVAQQSELWQQSFNRGVWRWSIRLFSRRFIWTKLIGEPGGAFLPSPPQVEAQLSQAFSNAANTFLFRDSDFASLMLRGYHEDEALPVHMKAKNYAHTRANLSRLRIVQGCIHQLSALGIKDVDGFSLSDFGSYCDDAAYKACWQGVLSAARPNAAFCERTFMNPLQLPFSTIHVDEALSAELKRTDHAIIYDIRAGILE